MHVITDIRVRSTFNAFMWGFMAGDDHIVGDVSLIGDKGEPRHTFKISASYALGGFAGMNETRMGWPFQGVFQTHAGGDQGRTRSGQQVTAARVLNFLLPALVRSALDSISVKAADAFRETWHASGLNEPR